MRVFIAIDLPEEVKKYLIELQKQLPEAKMSKTKDFHLTLKFLGELTPERVERVKQILREVKFEKFSATTTGMGVFPNESYIRVVWVGLEPEKEILQLQQQIEELLGRDFGKEKIFKAHLTLARVKFVADKDSFLRQLKEIKTERKTFAVEGFRLKESILSPKGPTYRDLAVFPQSL
ncbi:MAG: RNA 2',3'-cyclic phosphodiesterase [Candidatus Woesearchaeota archaeon]